IRPAQSEVSDAFDLVSGDQLLLFSPTQGSGKLLTTGLSLLLWGAFFRWCAGVESLSDQSLIDHPHRRPIRRAWQCNPLVSQDRHQHALEPQCHSALILPPRLGPRIVRRRRSLSRPRRQPVDHHRGDRIAVFILLRRLNRAEGEGVFLPLSAASVLTDRQPCVENVAAEFLLAQTCQYEIA